MAAATFMVLAAILTAIGGWLLVRALIGDRPKGRKRCPHCWYDMQGSPGLVCPECGQDAGAAHRLGKTRRSPKHIALALLMIIAAWYPTEVGRRIGLDQERVRDAMIPTTWLAATYPTKDSASRRFAAERMVRTRMGALPTWRWQQRLLAWRAAAAFAADGSATAVSNDALLALVALNARSDVAIPYAVRLVTDPAITNERHLAGLYGIIASGALRNHDVRLVETLITGLEKPGDDCQTPVAFALLNLPDSLWVSLDDRALEQLALRLWKSKLTHGGYRLLDRLLLILETRPAMAKPILEKMLADIPVFSTKWPSVRTVETLHMLRKLQGRPAPLAVVTAAPRIIWNGDRETSLEVRLENRESERPDLVRIQFGGDDRGGRQERWRLEVRHLNGAAVVEKNLVSNLGGLSGYGPLPPDKPFETHLKIADYIAPLKPGTYTLRVQYHDRIPFGDLDRNGGRVIFESDPVELIVAAD